jgi:hypothetical protein
VRRGLLRREDVELGVHAARGRARLRRALIHDKEIS